MRNNLEQLATIAIHEEWEGEKLRHLLGLFLCLGEPLPVDLALRAELELGFNWEKEVGYAGN